MNNYLKEIGERLKNKREDKGMNLNELSEKLNRTKSSISKIETGSQKSLDIGLLKHICDVLEVGLNDVLGEYESTNTETVNVNMTVNKLFEEILSRYKTEKKEDFKGNEVAEKLRNQLPKQIKEIATLRESYKVVGSPGKGQWAEIPWVSIFDKDITDTATFGFYLVYLFTEDMKGVYLSLNQGWTFYKDIFKAKEGRIQIGKVSDCLRGLMNTPIDSFNIKNINLKGSGDLSKGYEAGNIISKYYSIESMPNDDALVSDLHYMLGIYNEIKGLMGDYRYDEFIGKILETNIVKVDEKKKDKEKSKGQSGKGNKKSRTISSSLNAKLQALKNERNKEIGMLGERFIYENEIRYLTENGKRDLADNVEWVSNLEDGIDGSVDIKSFFLDGTIKNIEVKSSSQKTNNIFTFYISKNEINVALENKGNYILTLVDGVQKNEDESVSGNIVKEIRDPFDSEFKAFSETLNNGISIEGNNYVCKYKIK